MNVFDAVPPAYAACSAALADLSPAELAAPTACPEFSVADLIDHLHLAMVRLGGLAGATLSDSDDLPSLVTGALDAWRARGLDGDVDLRGPLPAAHAAAILPLELAVHGWDVASAVGRPYAVDDAAVAFLLDAAHEIIPSRRGPAFGPEVVPPADATPLQRLLAFTGREV